MDEKSHNPLLDILFWMMNVCERKAERLFLVNTKRRINQKLENL
jgi:hypothetical protein